MTERPLPLPDDVTAPYWQATARHSLQIQWCAACVLFIHEPQARCPRCASSDLAFAPVSGHGTVYSFTTLTDAPAAGFAQRLPLTIVIVELVEQARLFLTMNLVGPAEKLTIGDAVMVTFEDVSDDTTQSGTITLPQCRRVTA